MDISITESIVAELSKLLMPLKRLNDFGQVKRLFKEIGFDLTAVDDVDPNLQQLIADLVPLVNITIDLAGLVADLIDAGSDEETLVALTALAKKIPEVIDVVYTVGPDLEATITTIIPNIPPDAVESLAAKLSRRILEYLLYQYLFNYYPRIFSVFHLLGILEPVQAAGDSYPVNTIHWARLPKLFSDPMALADEVYQWNVGSDTFDGDKFLTRVEVLLHAFKLHGGIYTQEDGIRAQFGRTDPADDKEIRMPLYQTGVWPDNHFEADINLCPIPSGGNKNAGLALYPYITAGFDLQHEIAQNWVLGVAGNLDPQEAGLGIKLRAPHELELIDGLFTQNPVDSLDQQFNACLEISLKRTSPADQLTYLFGQEDSSHVALKDAELKLAVALQNNAEEIFAELDIKEFTIAINPGTDADGFLQKILSGINIKIFSDLTIGISNLDGFYFRGSSALTVTIPVNKQLGPLYVDSIHIGIGIDENIEVILAVSLSAALGPVAASVTRIGIRIPIKFPPDCRGNLGPLQVEVPKFLPPIGAGMVLDAAIIVGGGYIEFDDENKRYAGILELKIGEIGLVAIALITTRMPDGSDGFSMVVNIGVTFCPAIQLSYGFTLNGVGGLIGINRQANVDFLREGIRAGTLNSILFPENPVQNANRIISDMRNAFPAVEGRFVVGPMVKLGWGTPAIITADICIILDLPMPVRILLLGQVAVALPESEHAVISLHLDVLGVVDFDTQSLSIDATLYDSKLLTYSLSGDAALRLNWGNKPDFALSVGGFHPSFAPPPAFPSLNRLTLDLSISSELQLICKMYQALTPNTLQFGANVQIHANLAGAKLDGHLGYDTLIYFSPFSFAAIMHAGVCVKYEGYQLASVQLELVLSGPIPWNARGTASFTVLAWDVAIDFNETWGPDTCNPIEPVDPWPSLEEALGRNESWGCVFGNLQPVETFLAMESEEDEDEPVLVHPAGSLEVRENVLPLNMTLDLLGNAPVKTFDRFELNGISIGENQIVEAWAYVNEYFARGQFERLSDSQKLSIPSFEKMAGGFAIDNSEEFLFTEISEQQDLIQDLIYENILIGEDLLAQKIEPKLPVEPWKDSRYLLKDCAQANAKSHGKNRFKENINIAHVEVIDEEFVIVSKDTLEPVDEMNVGGTSRIAMEQLLAKLQTQYPSAAKNYMVLPACELEVA